MIYVQDKYFRKQLNIIQYFLECDEFDFIVWLYPESRLKHLFGFELSEDKNSQSNPVTTYSEGVVSKSTTRQRLTKLFIEQLSESKRVYTRNCDSCVLYKSGDKDWYASIIGHEGISLIKNDGIIEDLLTHGFNASFNKPSYW